MFRPTRTKLLSLVVLLVLLSTSLLEMTGATVRGVGNSTTLYLPGIHLGTDWQTTIALTSLKNRSVNVTLEAYNKDGHRLSESTAIFRPGETREIDSQTFPANTESLKLESSGNLIGNVLFATADGTKSEALPALAEAALQLDFPTLMRDDAFYKTITLLNPNPAPASVEAVALDANGQQIDQAVLSPLASMESLALPLASIFGQGTLENLAVLRITSDGPLVGFQLVDHREHDLVALPALTTRSQGWTFPVISQGDGLELWTEVKVFNPGDMVASITIEAYDENNKPLGTIESIGLAPGTSHSVITETIGGVISSSTAYIGIISDQPVTGFETIGVVNGAGLTAAVGISVEEETVAGVEIRSSKNGAALNAYFMVRALNGEIKSTIPKSQRRERAEKVLQPQPHSQLKSPTNPTDPLNSTVTQWSNPNLSHSAYTSGPFVSASLVGQCTWYVYGRIQETALITSQTLTNSRNRNGGRGIFLGNASTWPQDADAAGLARGTQAREGAIAVWTNSAGGFGHVAFVERVLADGTIQVTESNNRPMRGMDVVVNLDNTRLRSGAGTAFPIVWNMPRFTVMRVTLGPQAANGFQWYKLEGNGRIGWAAWLNNDGTAATSSSFVWNFTRIRLQAVAPFSGGSPTTFIYLNNKTNCSYSISPASQSFGAGAATGSVSVTAGNGCAWTAGSNASWITITSGNTGAGNGVVNFSVAANSSTSSRTGTLTIAGRTFTVTQAGVPGCTATPINSGQTVSGSLTTSDCRSPVRGSSYYADRYSLNASAGQQVAISLTSSAFDAYLYLIAPSGSVIAQDDDDGGGSNSRIPVSGTYSLPSSGTYIIEVTSYGANGTGGYSLSLSGSTCTYSISPTNQSFGSAGGTASVSVTAGSGCGWTAVSNASWITINSSGNGNGNGTVNYSLAANGSTSSRTGTLTIAGQTFTVTQAGSGGCTISVTPLNIGQTVNGALSTSDCRSPVRGSGHYADRYSFSASAGQQVAILLTSSAFDTYLYLTGPSGSVIAGDDDGGGGANSRIPAGSGSYSLPSSGTFTIEVTSYGSNATGNYTLSLSVPIIVNPITWEFNTNGNFEGWTVTNVSSASVNSGALFIDPAGVDPYASGPAISASAASYNYVRLRMASNALDGGGAIYFKTQAENFYSEDKKVTFSVNYCSLCGNAGWYEYTVYMRSHSKWTGAITGIRLDPANSGQGGTNRDAIGIDYIRLTP